MSTVKQSVDLVLDAAERPEIVSYTDDPVWHTVRDYPLDDPEASLTLTKRLYREMHGWDLEFTERVMEEYRRFFYLMCLGEHPVTPSDQVDQAWHIHILYCQSYRELCMSAIGRFIDHGPTKGGQQQVQHFDQQYRRTLDLYRRVFGEEPPRDIWPPSEERFANAADLRWVDSSKYDIVPYETHVAISRTNLWMVAMALLMATCSIVIGFVKVLQ